MKRISVDSMAKEYLVRSFTTNFFSGTLNESKMEQFLNRFAAEGWRLARTIHEQKRVWIFFNREAHFAIFERDV